MKPNAFQSLAKSLVYSKATVLYRGVSAHILAGPPITSAAVLFPWQTWADQASRASLSIVLNISEGMGRGTLGQIRQFLSTARGSAWETRSCLDIYPFDGLPLALPALADDCLAEIDLTLSRLMRDSA